MTKLRIILASFAIALAAPAMAWTVQEAPAGIKISHQSNGLEVEMACRSERDGLLGFRVTGLNANNIAVLTAVIIQSDGSSNSADVGAEGTSTTVEGRLSTPIAFLDAFASGIRFRLLADGVTVMDTDLSGTAVARSRLAAICGF